MRSQSVKISRRPVDRDLPRDIAAAEIPSTLDDTVYGSFWFDDGRQYDNVEWYPVNADNTGLYSVLLLGQDSENPRL